MSEIILSINAGSSSLKVSVYKSTSPNPIQLAEAQIDGLTAPPAKLKYNRGDVRIKGEDVTDVHDQGSAFKDLLDRFLNDDGLPEVKDKESIKFASHRVVHGGDFSEAQIINKDTYGKLEELSDLAPLHNAAALSLVRAIHDHLPHATNIAFFDSAFHATIPKQITAQAIDPKIANRNKLRKYGFHGLSYGFIVSAISEYLDKPLSSLNIIALHLGSGASVCAVKNGLSYDTSMGLTPLAGLPGATRSGSVDPSLIFHYTHHAGRLSHNAAKGMRLTEAEEILNKESGWKALTGTTDFGQISTKAAQGDEMCKLAFDIFVDRILNFVAGYYVKLGGKVDAMVFAGGIGEKGAELRDAVIAHFECLGFGLDGEKNVHAAEKEDVVVDISDKEARHKVLVCRTDEQLQMARGVVRDGPRFGKQQ
ncbi:acetate kinase [Rhizodiscina lignyota]|uniref:Probable acetate kinase n=1 Tax=Rhizodiscina lignyota TaxID=1504668 RepID=A0A9P4M8D1_9PEZI|nr:acetate kinase [Rhizodiscina lignyota]